jgi:superfamily I DNA and/or RNA helicase
MLNILASSAFPWPRAARTICPTVFVQCSSEEDIGGRSKINEGQAHVVRHIVTMLTTPVDNLKEGATNLSQLNITVLSPYTRQVKHLKTVLPSQVPSFTVDSFQGRESDIVIFSTVRCNADGDIGFVDDARRLNVLWTRAKLALIIVGDRRTMTEGNQLWRRAIEACMPVAVTVPEVEGELLKQ